MATMNDVKQTTDIDFHVNRIQQRVVNSEQSLTSLHIYFEVVSRMSVAPCMASGR